MAPGCDGWAQGTSHCRGWGQHGWPTCLPARSPAALLLASTYPHQMACQWAGVPRGCTRQGDTWPATIPEGSRCHVMSRPCTRSLAESLWTQRPDPSTTQVCRGRQAHTREPSQGREGAWHQNPGPGTDAPEPARPRDSYPGCWHLLDHAQVNPPGVLVRGGASWPPIIAQAAGQGSCPGSQGDAGPGVPENSKSMLGGQGTGPTSRRQQWQQNQAPFWSSVLQPRDHQPGPLQRPLPFSIRRVLHGWPGHRGLPQLPLLGQCPHLVESSAGRKEHPSIFPPAPSWEPCLETTGSRLHGRRWTSPAPGSTDS